MGNVNREAATIAASPTLKEIGYESSRPNIYASVA